MTIFFVFQEEAPLNLKVKKKAQRICVPLDALIKLALSSSQNGHSLKKF
jgi:hypothetical protein